MPAETEKLKILIYGLNYAPELTGIGKYSGEMAEWLVARGHEICVVTAPPYYPEWRVHEDYRGRLYRSGRLENGCIVSRTPVYVPRKPSGPKRILHLISFVLGSLPVMLVQIIRKPDVVITVVPTFFGAPLGLFVARASDAVAWLHIQDFEMDAAFAFGILKSKGPVRQLALSAERVFMRRFARVSSISTKMVARAQAKGVLAERTVLFPNWVDVEQIYPLTGANPLRRKLGLEGKIVLLYSGNMGTKQGLEVLAPLAKAFAPSGELADDRVHFLFCGDGAFRPQLGVLLEQLPNVTLLALQPVSLLNELLNAADIHLLPQRASAANLVMPSKLTGILASGRPVIATAHPGTQVAQVVDNGTAPCGRVVPPEDVISLREAVAQLVADPELRRRMGDNAREYAVRCLGREETLLQFERDMLEAVPALMQAKLAQQLRSAVAPVAER